MKVLLAVDGSPGSVAAVQSVLDRPWPPICVFRVLSCVADLIPLIQSMAAPPEVGDIQTANEQQLEEAKELIATAAQALREANLSVQTTIRHGDPAVAIVHEAAEWGADWILIGANDEKSAIERWLLGSTVQSVVKNAPCSVEVIRRRAAESVMEKAAVAQVELSNGAGEVAVA
jgi:nucleotide-binding universal stress UspA family protein